MPFEFNVMKRILKDSSVLACMILLAASCRDFREEYHEPVELRFSPAVAPATRASYGLYPEDGSFGVWGFTLPHGKSWDTGRQEASVMIDGERVSLYADGWRTEKARIWDHECRTTFIAWSPYEQETVFDHERGVCISSFDVLSDSPDPMFSYPVADLTEPEVGGSVGISFHHALAFVEIRALSDVEKKKMILKGVTVTGLKHSGDFQSLPEPHWTTDDSVADFVFLDEESELASDAVTLGEARRVIPQTAVMKVDLTLDVYDQEGKLLEEGRTVSTDDLRVVWNPGRMYVYTVRISDSDAEIKVEMLK